MDIPILNKSFRFTVNIPNPTGDNTSVKLRLKPAKMEDLQLLHLNLKPRLKVIRAGISLNPYAAKDEEYPLALNLKLMPYASTDVHININIEPSNEPGIAAFHLIDQRGEDFGGVLLVCVNRPYSDHSGQIVYSEKPCPATFAMRPYMIIPGEDPSKFSDSKIKILSRNLERISPLITVTPVLNLTRNLELVAPITNPTSEPLNNTRIYLESLGTGEATFIPGTWNAGTLKKNDIFYATWPLYINALLTGNITACVVVTSKGMDPVRLNVTILEDNNYTLNVVGTD